MVGTQFPKSEKALSKEELVQYVKGFPLQDHSLRELFDHIPILEVRLEILGKLGSGGLFRM